MNSTNATVNDYPLISSEKYDELLDKWDDKCFSSDDKQVIKYLRNNKKKIIGKTYLMPEYVANKTSEAIGMSVFENICSMISIVKLTDRKRFHIPIDNLGTIKWMYQSKDEVYFIEKAMICNT